MILDGVIGSPEQQSNQEFFRFFGLIGKAVGVVAGIVATRFVLGRYTIQIQGDWWFKWGLGYSTPFDAMLSHFIEIQNRHLLTLTTNK